MTTILLILATAVALLLAYAAVRPAQFSLARSTTIAAPPDKVFALINDLRQFNTWNVWSRMEPDIVLTYGSSSAGVGGSYQWKGKKTGEGGMQITASEPPRRVAAQLDFVKPFEAHNLVVFDVQPQGERGSAVTWTMSGPMPYVSRLMTIFVSMDKMVGKDFEGGLANLKALAEKP